MRCPFLGESLLVTVNLVVKITFKIRVQLAVNFVKVTITFKGVMHNKLMCSEINYTHLYVCGKLM